MLIIIAVLLAIIAAPVIAEANGRIGEIIVGLLGLAIMGAIALAMLVGVALLLT